MNRSPDAVRKSVTDHLKSVAKSRGQQFNSVQRAFVMGRFLARVFDFDPEGWILKGGVGMMVRLPEARYSKDIDLIARAGASDSLAQLRAAAAHHVDPFRFDVGQPSPLHDGKGVKVTVTAPTSRLPLGWLSTRWPIRLPTNCVRCSSGVVSGRPDVIVTWPTCC